MGGFGVKVQHFPLTLLVVLTTLTLPCERDLTAVFQFYMYLSSIAYDCLSSSCSALISKAVEIGDGSLKKMFFLFCLLLVVRLSLKIYDIDWEKYSI